MNIIVVWKFIAFIFKIRPLFNYLIFISYYISRIIDILTELLNKITPNIIYLNEYLAKFYIIIMITIYFIRKI